jgi:rhamnosyltransferase
MMRIEQFHVVLCSHNGEKYIQEQIRSILRQSETIDAIHVHDFASTDGTLVILDSLRSEAGGKLAITSHSDAPGTSASFIRALQLTEPLLGEKSCVFLADQDDVWLPEKLVTIKGELARRQLGPNEPFILFHDVQVVDEELRLMRPTYYTGNPFRLPRDVDGVRLMMANPAIGHTMLLSPPLVHKIVAWPETGHYMMHDWLAMLIASRIGRIEHVPLALSLYRQHGNNVLGAFRTRPGVPSVTRLLNFVDRLINQAVSFSRAIRLLPARTGVPSSEQRSLEALCRQGYRTSAVALSIAALVRGPTWQRKAIGLLLLTRAFIGPLNRRSAQ